MEPDEIEEVSVEEIITELTERAQPLLNSRLARFSYLTYPQLKLLERVWLQIEPERRRQIVRRLVELAEDNLELSFDRVMKSLLKDPDAEVRSKAIEGLCENEDVSLIPTFIRMLESDSSEQVQAAAALALGRFALLAEYGELKPEDAERVTQALLAATRNITKPPEARRRALEAVSALSLPEVKRAILEYYHSDNPLFKVSAVFAMGRNCHREWLPALLEEMTSEEPELRYEAAGAIGEVGEQEAVPRLIQLATDDPDMDVRLTAVQALGKVGGDNARKFLQKLLTSPNQAVRQAAGEALEELGVMENHLPFGVSREWLHPGEEN